jgi:putative transposase
MKMHEISTPEQVAAFRYSLIAPIVSKRQPLAPGEIKKYFEQVATQTFEVPGQSQMKLSTRTLERYLSQYRKNGWDGLLPKPRKDKGNYRVSEEIIAEAVALRRDRPERSVEQIIYMLEESKRVERGVLASSTLSRHLRKAGVSQRELLTDSDRGYRRFEVEGPNLLWQSDAQHTLYLPDPRDPKKRKKAILFAVLDDFSRLIIHGQFYWDEKLPRLEDCLKKSILKHGVPEQFYCDNGNVYSSLHLKRICGKLGIRLSHSRPYRPAGRGKIERFFRFVDTSFKPEAYDAIQNGQIRTLQELNDAFQAWLEGYYHQRKHGSTQEAPTTRYQNHVKEVRHVSVTELTDIFLWEEERTVDKTGCISLNGNRYEVDLELARHKVKLRFDPFDLQVLQVFYEEQKYSDAKPLELKRRYDRRVQPDQTQDIQVTETSVSFFEVAEKKKQEKLQKEIVQYAKGGMKNE